MGLFARKHDATYSLRTLATILRAANLMKISFAVVALLGFTAAKPNDLPTCISDIEAAIPDVEKIIADFKAGNYT